MLIGEIMCNTELEIKQADKFYKIANKKELPIEFINQIIRVHLHHYYIKTLGHKTKKEDSDLVILLGLSRLDFDKHILQISKRYKTSDPNYTPPEPPTRKAIWNHGWYYEEVTGQDIRIYYIKETEKEHLE